GDHSEIAMARFAGMHEKGRCSGGCEGRSELACNMAGFAHSGHDDAALRCADDIDGSRKAAAKTIAQCGGKCINAASFGFKGPQCRRDRRSRTVARQVSGFWFGHGGLDSMKT